MAGNGRVVVGCKHGEEDPDTVANAELKGASPLMEFAGDGALTFTY
jgi:hypothetical protein